MPTPPAIVVGNWKMNTDLAAGVALAKAVAEGAASAAGVELVICPPFVSLAAVRNAVAGGRVTVGAQNMHTDDNGPFTGEIAPSMLADLCDYVIIGHSERRLHFKEADDTIGLKAAAALRHGLRPIICVGETQEEREMGQTMPVIWRQVTVALSGVGDDATKHLVIAYEPVGAIGTGRATAPETVQRTVCNFIRPAVKSALGAEASETVPILYGGSVQPGNVGDFAADSGVNGVLVGRASLDADDFLSIARAFASDQTSVRDLLRRSLLPVFTEMASAISYWEQESKSVRNNPNHRPNGDRMADGLRMIKEKLNQFNEWEKIVPIGQIGDAFDWSLHVAVGNNANSDYPRDTVVEVVELGYRVDNTVVKQAKVIVSR